MLSVEPHHTHVPLTPRKEHEPIHYSVTRNEATGAYSIKTHQIENEPVIIGNILVVESAKTSAEDVKRLLEEHLGSVSPSKDKDGGYDEPELWIHRALYALQKHGVAEQFDLEEFMTFARSYESRRLEDEAPALVAYPKLHKDHDKKASKHKFWISRPMSEHTKKNGRGEASTYGGLM